MLKNRVTPLALISFGALYVAMQSLGCSSDSNSGGGTGGRGTGGSSSGGAGTGGAATGGAATGGAPAVSTGGAGPGGSAGGSAGSLGGSAGAVGGGGGTAATGGAAGSAGGGAGAAGGSTSTGGAAGGITGGTGGRGGASGAAGGAAGSAGGSSGTGRAVIAPFMAGTITGTAVFSNAANGVSVTINLANCPTGTHPIHIHEGTACDSLATQGMHWGGSGTAQMPSRGEGIGTGTGEIVCNAQMVGGPLTYTRLNTDPMTRWTIGGDTSTNIIGHAMVVHSAVNATTREGCGIIQAE